MSHPPMPLSHSYPYTLLIWIGIFDGSKSVWGDVRRRACQQPGRQLKHDTKVTQTASFLRGHFLIPNIRGRKVVGLSPRL